MPSTASQTSRLFPTIPFVVSSDTSWTVWSKPLSSAGDEYLSVLGTDGRVTEEMEVNHHMYLKLAMVEAVLILKVEAGTWPRTELTRLSEPFPFTGKSPDIWMAGYRHLGHHTITQDAAVF